MQILAFTQSSFIKKVDYAKLVSELYDTKVSDDPDQDVYVKKLTGNVNVGLLEKCYNKKSFGFLFQDYEECSDYQAQYAGSTTSIPNMDVSDVFLANPIGVRRWHRRDRIVYFRKI